MSDPVGDTSGQGPDDSSASGSEPSPATPEWSPEFPSGPLPLSRTTGGAPRRTRTIRWPLAALIGGSVLALAVVLVLSLRPGKRAEPTPPSAQEDPPEADVPAGSPKPGEMREIEIAPGVKMTFCWVPPGECQLGSTKDERHLVLKQATPDGWFQEFEERRGKFSTAGFWLGRDEVTQAEWAAVMAGTDRATPSHFRFGGGGASELRGVAGTNRFPVENVSWDDCQEFLKRANARGGVEKALGRPVAFALPHEDQWEYACRGGRGNKQPFYFGNELNGTQANVRGDEPFGTSAQGPRWNRTTAVGTYAAQYPHPWGLRDMHGNVSEWCSNAPGAESGKESERVFRGGAWNERALGARSAHRAWHDPDHRESALGFRVLISGLP